jgi:hypothetical protein
MMSETTRQTNPNELSEIYAKLNKQDVEQFCTSYQRWNLQQRSVTLQEQIEDLHREIAANAELMEMIHPPAMALATMARLQASGVKDLNLLDRMLERGEDWLDRTIQRLEYCEQLDFILDDYTQWCQNALDGAYDWIDSMREGGTASSTEVPTGDTATEELLLQKLTSEEEQLSSSPETTLEQPELSALEESASALEEPLTIFPEELVSTPEEHASIIEESPISVETPSSPEEVIPKLQEEQVSQLPQLSQVSQPVEVSPASDSPVEEPITQASIEPRPTSDSEQSVRSESPIGEASENEQLISQVYIEHAERSIPAVTLGRRRNFLQRLAAKIWRR